MICDAPHVESGSWRCGSPSVSVRRSPTGQQRYSKLFADACFSRSDSCLSHRDGRVRTSRRGAGTRVRKVNFPTLAVEGGGVGEVKGGEGRRRILKRQERRRNKGGG